MNCIDSFRVDSHFFSPLFPGRIHTFIIYHISPMGLRICIFHVICIACSMVSPSTITFASFIQEDVHNAWTCEKAFSRLFER